MSSLLQAELLKLRTIRTPFVLLLVALGIALIAGGVQVGIYEYEPGQPTLSDSQMAGLIAGSAASIIMALIIGAVGATGELRHGTEYLNYLVSPRRWPQVVARIVAYLIFGMAFSVAVMGAVALLASAWAVIRVGEVPWGSDATRILLGVIVVSAAYMVIGLAVGTIIGNQAVAVVVVILWPLFIEGIVSLPLFLLDEDLAALLPFQAAQVLLIGEQSPLGFGPWASAATVLTWAAVLTAVGVWRTMRREAK